MPNLLTRQVLERVDTNGWIYVVHDNKDYRVKIKDIIALITAESLGLGNVDNTRDIHKPLSEAVQLALRAKADKSDVADFVKKEIYEQKVQELTTLIRSIASTPPASPSQPADTPSTPSITLEQVRSAITEFWNKEKEAAGVIGQINTKLATVQDKADLIGQNLEALTATVASIPRVTNAATVEDLDSLARRVDTIASSVGNTADIAAAKERLDQIFPKVETLENKTAGLSTWTEFKTDYDKKVADIAIAASRAKRAEEGLLNVGEQKPDMYLKWLSKLQYVREDKPSYGAIAWHDSPATYANEKAYYKIEPYFASTAVYYALEASPERTGMLAERWLNWWMKNMNPTTGSTLIHYTDGDDIFTALEGASPEVIPNNEDATDSNIAMFMLVLARYITHFGTEGLYADWKNALVAAYDALSRPDLKHTDNLTWAKTTYPIKYLMDNVEVWASLKAIAPVFKLIGDTARAASATGWMSDIAFSINNNFWDNDNANWKPSMDGAGSAPAAVMTNAYPDLLCQFWPDLFGFNIGMSRMQQDLTMYYENWSTESINSNTRAVDAQVALSAALKGDRDSVQRWLLNVPASRQNGPSYTWPFTCADAAITALILKINNRAEVQFLMQHFTNRISMLEEDMSRLQGLVTPGG